MGDTVLNRIRSALAGRYIVERLLGEGSTAAVYSARDLKHGRRVALKVLHPEVVSILGTARFLQEIRTTARLNHPHILPLFDSGEADGYIYYTMPVVEGESLRSRLDHESCMPLEAVLPIAEQIAGALSYAHGAAIVHRDIKPENILVDPRGHVWVADFGLACARATAGDQRLTSTGTAVGSPYYMSPEQAAGYSEVDGRSDTYSLACVLYEMLAGETPFSAKSVRALLAQHISQPPPAIRSRCPHLPPAVEDALRRAMSKDPADRFSDPRDLIEALQLAAVREPRTDAAGERAPPGTPSRRSRRPWMWAGIPLLAAAGFVVVFKTLQLMAGRDVASADSSRFVILPVERVGSADGADEEQLLRNAFLRWRDIEVVRGEVLARALARRGVSTLIADDYDDLGRDLRAGRIVRATVAAFGDSLRMDAALHDRSGREIARHTLRISRNEPRPDLYYARLADALLFPDRWHLEREEPGTDSRAAQQAYLEGLASIGEWDLARADSLFATGAEADPGFARAHAWRAQTVFWRHGVTPEVRTAAERAIAAADGPLRRGRLMAEALLDFGRGDYPAACERYAALLELDPRDYVATRGLADCHGLDPAVITDASSPTGWSFRSSGHQALLYHQRAFELLPASHRAYRRGGFLQLREGIFYTAVTAHRRGIDAMGDHFAARPGWNDTLEFHPVRRDDVGRARGPLSASAVVAVNRLRDIFFDVTAGWVEAYPRSPDALEAHAIAMELKGDTRALQTLDRARSYATDPEHAVNLSISEFWLRLKRAVPNAPQDARTARLLADSILEYSGDIAPLTARRMAAVAAVTGRGHLAARLARRAPRSVTQALEAGAVLLAYAAVGPYGDSLRMYERRVEAAISNLMTEEAPRARGELLGRAASLALPEYRMAYLDSADPDDYLITAMSAYARGDHDAVRRIFDRLAVSRSVLRPADVKVEVLLPEAWLLLRMGDARAALQWLAPTLDDIRFIEPGGLEDVAAAGPLPRAMLLRAEIANELGDAAAARLWAAVVVELWAGADAELRPMRTRASALASPSAV